MGWASGSQLAEEVWLTVAKHIPPKERKKVAAQIIDLFEQHDADDFSAEDSICQAADMYQEDYYET